MIKQALITSIAAAGLLLSAQASAHSGSVTIWKNNSHIHNDHGRHIHSAPPRRHAPKPKYNVNKEQRQQAIMIQQGIKKCLITPSEAAKLNKKQNRIKKAERRMRKDGLQHWERMKLKKRLHNARVQINRLTKNGKKCGRRGHGSRKRGYHHSHGSNHHNHSNGNHFHSHSNWGFSNDKGSFSISIGH